MVRAAREAVLLRVITQPDKWRNRAVVAVLAMLTVALLVVLIAPPDPPDPAGVHASLANRA